MTKTDAVKYFKTKTAIARALGIHKMAVQQWPELIPELRARQLHDLTGGQLPFDAEAYRRERSA